MVIEKIIISNEPPAVKNVIWGKPVNNGFMLYYNNGGWKPFKLGDNGATVTASGNRIYYTDSTHSTPLYVEGTNVKYQLGVNEVNTSSPADEESYNIGEEIYCDVIIGNHGSAPVNNIVVEGKAFASNSDKILSDTKYEVGTLNPEEQSTSLHFSHTVTLEDCSFESPQIVFEITLAGVDSITGKEVEGNGDSREFPLKPFSVNFLNVDVGDGTPIEGNIVQVWNGNALVDEWTSIADDSEPHRVYVLLPNQTYRVHVSEAAEDYAAPEDFTFTISDNGEVTSPTMEYHEAGEYNDYASFIIEQEHAFHSVVRVLDPIDGNPIIGAHAKISISNAGDKEYPDALVVEWNTTEEDYHFKGKTGYPYFIEITAVPDGYLPISGEYFLIGDDGAMDGDPVESYDDGIFTVVAYPQRVEES